MAADMASTPIPSRGPEGSDSKTAVVRYGPGNPHPLSQLKTELVWDGKYDEYGRRREVDIAACAMPMQKIETIDQPRSEAVAQGELALFEKKKPAARRFPQPAHLGR